MELHEDPEKRGKQVGYLLDAECTTEKALKMYDSWGKYYDQVSLISGGSRIFQTQKGRANLLVWPIFSRKTA